MKKLGRNIFLVGFCISLTFCGFTQETVDSVVTVTASPDTVQNLFTPRSVQIERDTIRIREVDRRKIDSLKRLDAFWYADSAFPSGKKLQSTPPDEKTVYRAPPKSWLSTEMLVIILVICAALVIFFLLRTNVITPRRAPAHQDEQEHDLENIFEINYQREIEKALQENNFRLAVRLMFLRQLKVLANRNLIQYKQERTNLDYLMQMHKSKYYKDFFRLTRNYEYVWYGKFDLQPETFNVIRNDFENFDRSLN